MRYREIITELTGIKSLTANPSIDKHNINQHLSKFNFSNIGKGLYGDVFTDPTNNNRVLKIYVDPAYDNFIKFCKMHPENPNLPRFKGNPILLRKIRNIDARMIRMEKLEPVEDRDEWNKISSLIDLSRFIILGQLFFDSWERGAVPPEIVKERISQITAPKDLELFNTLCMLFLYSKNLVDIDIHRKNVMKRGDQVVITDPFIQ